MLPTKFRINGLDFLLLAIAVLLSACSTVTTVKDPVKSPIKADESAVVLSVTSNTGQISGFDTITVRAAGTGKNLFKVERVLNRVLPGLSRDTSLFVGKLPAGRYELVVMSDLDTNQYLAINANTQRLIGPFEVTAAAPVDLGRLIIAPLNHRVIVGRSSSVWSNKSLLSRFAPQYAALFGDNPATGWLQTHADADIAEAIALATPVGADNITELADGTMVAASRMGTVLVRSSGGQWGAVRAPGIESILDVMPYALPGIDLLAVGEFNTVLTMPANRRELVPIYAGELPPGNLLFIAGTKESGWHIVSQNGDEVSILHSDVLEGGQWRRVRTTNVGLDFWNGTNAAWFWRYDGGFGYATSHGEIGLFDYETATWADRKAPKGNRLISVAPNPDGSIGALTSPGGGFGGITASTFLSSDGAQTWQKIGSPYKIKVAAPMRDTSGTMYSVGGVYGNSGLQLSKDGGNSWHRVSDFDLRDTITVLPSGRLLSLIGAKGSIFAIRTSTDQGANWTVEHSNYDERIAELLK